MSETLIVASFLFIVYSYFGYPVILWIWTRGRRVLPRASEDTPSVTVVIAAHNEEAAIGETISSILRSEYPSEKLDVVVVSDASTDRTETIVESFPAARVRLERQTGRQGQTRGLFHGAQTARGEVVVLADASGLFFPDTVRQLTAPLADTRVGAVSGHKVIAAAGTAVSKGDGAYLGYDTTLRWLESRTGSSWIGCQGGLFAIRRDLFTLDFPLEIAADNATCYRLYERGYGHVFNPHAKVTESSSQDLGMEFRRKVRIIVLGMRGLVHFRHLLSPWKHPAFFFQNVSHKLCRWLVPWALIVLWAASAVSRAPWAQALFGLQSAFYLLALVGILYRGRVPRGVSIPAYFTTVNAACLVAWATLSRNYTVWTPPSRTPANQP